MLYVDIHSVVCLSFKNMLLRIVVVFISTICIALKGCRRAQHMISTVGVHNDFQFENQTSQLSSVWHVCILFALWSLFHSGFGSVIYTCQLIHQHDHNYCWRIRCYRCALRFLACLHFCYRYIFALIIWNVCHNLCTIYFNSNTICKYMTECNTTIGI